MLPVTLDNFFQLVPAAGLLVFTCIILLASVFFTRERRDVIYLMSQLALLITFALVVSSLSYHKSFLFADGQWIIDEFAVISKIFILIVTFFAFLYARKEVAQLQLASAEFYTLLLLSTVGMMVMCSANSFLVMFLGLELMSLPLYALCAFNRRSKLGSEAAIKYFITGAIASGLLLYGLSLIYGVTHSLDYNTVTQALGQLQGNEHWIVMIGLAFAISSVAFKFGMVPFHMWVPDVYEGAPVSVVMFIGSAPKIAALTLFVRLLYSVFGAYHVDWSQLLTIIAIASMIFGNLLAIIQTNIKRLFGYSSIAHVGYMILGIIAGSNFGLSAAMFYIVSYSFMALGAFGIIILLNRVGYQIENITDLKGLNNRHPWLAFMMLLVLFSMAGIPPTVGFMAKFGVVLSLVRAHQVWLAALALVFAIIGIYYYLRVVKVMYFDSAEDAGLPLHLPTDMVIAISINGLLTLALGIFPSVLLNVVNFPLN